MSHISDRVCQTLAPIGFIPGRQSPRSEQIRDLIKATDCAISPSLIETLCSLDGLRYQDPPPTPRHQGLVQDLDFDVIRALSCVSQPEYDVWVEAASARLCPIGFDVLSESTLCIDEQGGLCAADLSAFYRYGTRLDTGLERLLFGEPYDIRPLPAPRYARIASDRLEDATLAALQEAGAQPDLVPRGPQRESWRAAISEWLLPMGGSLALKSRSLPSPPREFTLNVKTPLDAVLGRSIAATIRLRAPGEIACIGTMQGDGCMVVFERTGRVWLLARAVWPLAIFLGEGIVQTLNVLLTSPHLYHSIFEV